nr:hypothetical protein [Candidatus Sigynarchaeota archaeon]
MASAAGIIASYGIFTLISGLLYPGGIDPLTEYISYLGDYGKNPSGGIFYNIGCILGGSFIIPFVISLEVWKDEKKAQSLFLRVSQLIGFADGIALIFIGIFHSGHPYHGDASSAFFVTNLAFFIFTTIALLFHPAFYKGIAIYALLVSVFNLIYVASDPGPVIEWITVFTALGFVALLIVNMIVRKP